MKKFITIIALLLISISCKAQIIDAFDSEVVVGDTYGAYYQDIFGFREQFIGRFIYTNGNTSLTVEFQKRDNLLRETEFNSYNEDILIGEFRYIENGVEKINTLNTINTNYGSDYFQNMQHNLFGYMFIRRPKSFPRCNECLPNEKRMVFSYTEPNYDAKGVANGHMVVRKFIEGGIEKIKIWFYTTNQIQLHDEFDNPINPEPYKIPFGEYVLIKQ